MIRTRDFDIFSMSSNKVNYHRECSIPALLSKNVGPEKVVRNESGSLYLTLDVGLICAEGAKEFRQ